MSDRLALLIGNGRFESDPDLPALFGPRHDVSSLGQILSDPEVGNFIVFEHLDRDSRLLVPELERLLSITDPDATVLLYYGGFVASKPGRGLFLATADTELASVDETAVPVSLIKGLLRSCAARHKAVILDCCYGGPAGRIDEADIERELRRIRTDVDPDLHVIASPAAGQSAEAREITTESGLEGRLTRCIVEGLSTGAADRDGDNRTGVRDLNEYLGMRLGEARPLWSGPLDGADPEIVANPHPISGLEIDGFTAAERDLRFRTRRFFMTVAAIAVLVVAAISGLLMRGEPAPGTTAISEFYSGPGLPETVGMVGDLRALRDVIDRTGWIEHSEPLDGSGPRYPGVATLRRDPISRGPAGTVVLALRQWVLFDFGEGVHAFGVSCAPGLNIASATVEMVNGAEYTFDIRTDRPGGEFFGFVARQQIRRVRITATSNRFVAERLYAYASREYPEGS